MKQNILSLLGSDVLASEQFAETFRQSEHREPEKALLLAVLEDAVDCFLEYHAAEDRIGKGRFPGSRRVDHAKRRRLVFFF